MDYIQLKKSNFYIMKKSKILAETTDSREYKFTKRFFDHQKTGRCTICGPRTGCNSGYGTSERTWKKHRKSQYKN